MWVEGGSINTFSTILWPREANSRKHKDQHYEFYVLFCPVVGHKDHQMQDKYPGLENFWDFQVQFPQIKLLYFALVCICLKIGVKTISSQNAVGQV